MNISYIVACRRLQFCTSSGHINTSGNIELVFTCWSWDFLGHSTNQRQTASLTKTVQASILVAKHSLLCNSDTPWCCYGPSPELEWNKAAFCCCVLERLSDWYLYCKTFDNVVMEMSAYFSSDSGPMNTWLPQRLSWIILLAWVSSWHFMKQLISHSHYLYKRRCYVTQIWTHTVQLAPRQVYFNRFARPSFILSPNLFSPLPHLLLHDLSFTLTLHKLFWCLSFPPLSPPLTIPPNPSILSSPCSSAMFHLL